MMKLVIYGPKCCKEENLYTILEITLSGNRVGCFMR